MKLHPLLFLFFCLSLLSAQPSSAAITLAHNSKPRCAIIQQSTATDSEKHAASELKLHLDAITGGSFQILSDTNSAPKDTIIIGPGPLASQYFPDLDLTKLGGEEYVIRSTNHHLLLAGGRPRGTLYAVDRFLQDQCGVRWWTPWATNIPHHPSLAISDLNLRGQPAFEYRGTFWSAGFDPLWKARNGGNNEASDIPKALGDCVRYKGFAHTFYPLVPPDKYFDEHPDWYSLVKGKRVKSHGQLCLTNPQLRDFVVQRVKEWLHESPDCKIVSVTQNDWYGACECTNCAALDAAEGSHAGTMITFVNYIAEKIEPEFPDVAVDTFAYQYTRKPPKTIKTRPNVIVRLCSIECNFREPLSDPSNVSFSSDIEKWAAICKRLYIWDYVTDFGHYVYPHPNWFTLGDNVRYFQAHNVKGVFEEGAYGGPGAEMAELRTWVLAQLLWNPQQDDRKLIREFLDGYYGPASAKYISEYLDLLYNQSKGFYLACFLRKDPPPYLDFKTVARAEQLWQQAEKTAKGDYLDRVRMSHLPIRFVFLKDWQRLHDECEKENLHWPLNESRKAVAEEFKTVCKGVPGEKEWTHVTKLNEPGLKVKDFLKPME